MAQRLLLALALSFPLTLPANAQKSAPQAIAMPTPERMEKDTPRATPAGTTFTAPKEWTVTARGSLVTLVPPELDLSFAIIGIEAKDAEAAVAAAWAAYRPGFKRPLKLVSPQAAGSGWEEQKFFQYETSPNERAVVIAVAQRAGEAWTVSIVDGAEATLAKRGSQVKLAGESLRPKGFTHESFAGRKAHPLDPTRQTILKEFVANAMKMFGTPGVGLALIDGGKTIWVGGLGVKELGKPDAVDADTLFMAASNTKALTTLLMARLVDEGKLRWDQPVTEAFPSFKLGDAATTKQVLVRHLVCACTGMPRQDMIGAFSYSKQTPASLLALLGKMQPTSRFGEVYQYSNQMAAAAGFIAGATALPGMELGAAYDEAMRTKIFDPLGMKTTTFDFARALAGNVAQPHGSDIDGKIVRTRIERDYQVVPVRPAGGVWTSARELARYVELELAKGMLPDGKRLVSQQNLLMRSAPQATVSENVTYGMGLIVDKSSGVTVVRHGGDIAGYRSDMMWLPEHGVGAVILTNADGGQRIRGPLLRRLLEVVFDGKPKAEAALKASAVELKAANARQHEGFVVPAAPDLASGLAHRYTSAELGALTVRKEDSATVFDVGDWKSAVASRKNPDGTTSFITIDQSFAGFEFVAADKDGKRRLVVREAQHEYFFVEDAGKPKP